MSKEALYRAAAAVLLVMLIGGYALYFYLKNNTELQPENDNYSVLGLAISGLAILMSAYFFITSLRNRSMWHLYLGIECILAIVLLILWI